MLFWLTNIWNLDTSDKVSTSYGSWNNHCVFIWFKTSSFKVSKAINERSESGFDDENLLYKFEEVYSINQTFRVLAIIGKCEEVQVCVSMLRK